MNESRLALLMLASSMSWTVHAADDLETLDEDFLSYLAEFEGDEDDWTIVEPPASPASATAKPAQPANERKSTTPTKPAPKASEPMKPATPDDGTKQ